MNLNAASTTAVGSLGGPGSDGFLPHASSTTCGGLGPSCKPSDANDTVSGGGGDADVLRFVLAVQSAIYTVATASNVAVLAVLAAAHRKQRLSRMYLLVVHLCLADLAVATFNILPNVLLLAHGVRWVVPSDFLCRSVNYFSLASVYASAYVLVATAIDRYVAICHPMALANVWCRERSVHALAAVAWATALAFSVPQLALFRYSYSAESSSVDCWAPFHDDPHERRSRELAYALWFAAAVWFAPMIALTFCYASITSAVWRSRGAIMTVVARSPRSLLAMALATKSLGGGGGGGGGCGSPPPSAKDSAGAIDDDSAGVLTKHLVPSRRRGHSRWLSSETRRTVKLTLTVITSYVLCWSPWMVSTLMTSVVTEAPSDPVLSALLDLAHVITYFIGINSCVNPWICLCFNFKRLCRPKAGKPLGGSSKSAGGGGTITAHSSVPTASHWTGA